MQTPRPNKAEFYSTWHPHHTPKWLSHRLAAHIPKEFSGWVVDPACGAGNLLAAAVIRTGAAGRSGDVSIAGTDVSIRAVNACTEKLSRLLPAGNFQVT